MDDAIRRLRAEARQLMHGKVPTAIRYPAAFRAAALALAGPRLGRGTSIAGVARDLGLPVQSLGRWGSPQGTQPNVPSCLRSGKIETEIPIST